MTKDILVSGKTVRMRATAAIPRLYRIKFRRDIMKDMQKLQKAAGDPAEYTVDDLEMFENIAYIMAKHGDVDNNGNVIGNVPDSVEEWLDEFETFSIYEALPQIIELWGMNIETESASKKKQGK